MNVLSVCDGMSCGQIALNRSGIKYKKYYSSEIDKRAIKVTQHNYPETIQIGDITKWREWNLPKIDLLLAGTPCQGFSFSGKGLNFEDPRSKLFFDFVEILKHYKPKYWLFENVKMKKEWQNTISTILNMEFIEINSALVSAQNRKRLYWTNIKSGPVDFFGRMKTQIMLPGDKKIFLKDIIEDGFVDRDKSYCICANDNKGGNLNRYLNKRSKQIVFIRQRPRGYNKGGDFYKKSPTLTANEWICNNKLCIVCGEADINGFDSMKRVYSTDGKCPTLSSVCGGNHEPKIALNDIEYRKLTPLECERLQTVPEQYTSSVSNSQRYKMLGNGWTVDVICHILKHMEI